MKRVTIILISVCALARVCVALTPGDLARVNFEQHPGKQISRDLTFRDENNRSVSLGEFFGTQPTILVLGYYRCPMLCTTINDGLIGALQDLRGSVGRDFQIVDVSIDPNEQPAMAAEKKALYLRRYGRSGASNGWWFLVGDEKSIAQLTNETGYRFQFDPQTRQYAHPSGVIVLTPSGKISRYIFGVNFEPKDLLDALTAAKEEKSTSVISQIILLCYHYNPITGRYGALILSILRIASVGFVGLIAGWVWLMARRSATQTVRAE